MGAPGEEPQRSDAASLVRGSDSSARDEDLRWPWYDLNTAPNDPALPAA